MPYNSRLNNSLNILGIRVSEAGQAGSFSGNSTNLLNYLKTNYQLKDVISAVPSIYIIRLLQMLSFHPNIAIWKFKSKVDPKFYRYLTKTIEKKIQSNSLDNIHAIIQIGAWYDLPRILNKTGLSNILKCSFHDGNLMTMLNSPLPKPALSQKRINAVYDIEKKIYEGMDLIFPMTHWLKNSFQNDYSIPENKLIVTGSGAYIYEDLIYLGKKDYSQPNILFVGTDFERKGGYILLRAFSKVKKAIPSAHLYIIGYTISEQIDGVTCFGQVYKKSKQGKEIFQKMYKICSVFVLPSIYEPFGISIVEAMANKIPCIGTNNCAMPEIIDEDKSGYLVPVNDSEQLADRIIEVLKDPVKAEQMGNYGRKKYLNNFIWDIVAEKIISAINKRF